jgi:ATP-dependent protease ClpP protease subunit
MKKIFLSGEIGWDIMAFEIEDQLKDANGEDVEFIFNTPGGFISEGNLIDDLILSYKKDFPSAQMMANIIEAQSYGSYLLSNPALDMIVARQNSVVMIHNPLMGIIGDYKDLKKSADVLERKAAMFAERYSEKMGKPVDEVRAMMDEETYFIGGNEIVDSGLADEVITDKEALKDSATLKAKAETKIEMLKIKIKNTKDDFEKIAAMAKEPLPSNTPAPGGENNQEVSTVKNADELKEKHPEIHAAVMAEGTKAGIDQEKEREKKRLEDLVAMKSKDDFKDIPQALERIDKGISDGETVHQVELGLMAVLRDPAVKAVQDSPGDVNQPQMNTPSGEETLAEDDEGF